MGTPVTYKAVSPNVKLGDDGTIRIAGVLLSYPHLFEPYAKTQSEKPKFSSKFLLLKKTHKDDIKWLIGHFKTLMTEKWKKTLPGADICLRDGEHHGKNEGDDNYFILSASEKKRPQIIDRDRTPLVEEDAEDKIYAGATVNVIILPWTQDNEYGKKLNANLKAVQFAKATDRIAGTQTVVDAEAAFDDVSGEFGGEETESSDDDGFGFN